MDSTAIEAVLGALAILGAYLAITRPKIYAGDWALLIVAGLLVAYLVIG